MKTKSPQKTTKKAGKVKKKVRERAGSHNDNRKTKKSI